MMQFILSYIIVSCLISAVVLWGTARTLSVPMFIMFLLLAPVLVCWYIVETLFKLMIGGARDDKR